MKTLVVKGNIFEASAACSVRDIGHWNMRETLYGETVLETDSPVEKLSAWFVEDCGRQAPYPIGSLLLYREGSR